MSLRFALWGIFLSLLLSCTVHSQTAFTSADRTGGALAVHGAACAEEWTIGVSGNFTYRTILDVQVFSEHTNVAANQSFSSVTGRVIAFPRRFSLLRHPAGIGGILGYEYQNYGEVYSMPGNPLSAIDVTARYIHTGVQAHLQFRAGDDGLIVPSAEITRLDGQDGRQDVTRYYLALTVVAPTSDKNAVSLEMFFRGSDESGRPNKAGVRLTFHGWSTPADQQ